MATVKMHEAKTNLSRLVLAVEGGSETEIVITRNGKPAARLVPVASKAVPRKRVGIAEGRFGNFTREEFDAFNEEIIEEMVKGPLFPPVSGRRKVA